jgi:hypothetical protein
MRSLAVDLNEDAEVVMVEVVMADGGNTDGDAEDVDMDMDEGDDLKIMADELQADFSDYEDEPEKEIEIAEDVEEELNKEFQEVFKMYIKRCQKIDWKKEFPLTPSVKAITTLPFAPQNLLDLWELDIGKILKKIIEEEPVKSFTDTCHTWQQCPVAQLEHFLVQAFARKSTRAPISC